MSAPVVDSTAKPPTPSNGTPSDLDTPGSVGTLVNDYLTGPNQAGQTKTESGSGQSSPTTVPSINPPTVPFDTTCWPPIAKGRARTLVLCFDGTGDQNSNIVTLFSLLKKNDPTRQMCYYQAGIGTYSNPNIAMPGATAIAETLDQMVAWYLHAHVQEGYEFLMQNYVAGDKICLFGFSRGAYTARALAGMLHSVGLIPQWNKQQVPFAWKIYQDNTPAGLIRAAEFKATFSINVHIEFVGVFDTVASVGIISRELPFAASNHAIATFRHALSLDERRVKFKANHFHNEPDISDATETKIKENQIGGTLNQTQALNGKRVNLEEVVNRQPRPETDFKEVWFAGCHCDVGGGSVSNSEKINLARIPLKWMIQESIATNTGILFDLALLDSIGLTVHNLPLPKNVPYPPIPGASLKVLPEDPKSLVPEEEKEEALSKVYDQLSLAWFWWILEILPLRTKHLTVTGHFVRGYPWPNLGNGRGIPDPHVHGLNIHRSVKLRMETIGYIPKAFWEDKQGKRRLLDIKKPEELPPINWVD
ncbi:hypothetical protein SISNIDRAFT_429507 [Sistotremastrum niveocremeum HHB9708]|uniref:T6SS Phospholipase effector Tle1-like catalytic domain-containing protein n=1 Tax=Sistotremastrum niveocremeum HHB9708 TaxID=1314777 RepID=A0A164TCT6_9AGAM|nr:hypothetical protein SISNIDRAFT_429507 [Sistotremastrum niveocremeum HHB9708]